MIRGNALTCDGLGLLVEQHVQPCVRRIPDRRRCEALEKAADARIGENGPRGLEHRGVGVDIALLIRHEEKSRKVVGCARTGLSVDDPSRQREPRTTHLVSSLEHGDRVHDEAHPCAGNGTRQQVALA